jgi:hypothetical protein
MISTGDLIRGFMLQSIFETTARGIADRDHSGEGLDACQH